MSIEINQEKLTVPVETGSIAPIESTPETISETTPSVPSVTQANVTPIQIIPEEENDLSKRNSPKVTIVTGAGDGGTWFALISRKEEGGDIEVL